MATKKTKKSSPTPRFRGQGRPGRTPTRRPRIDMKMVEKLLKERRGDSWMSALTGIGTRRDKRTSMNFGRVKTNWQENLNLWQGDDIAARIVEMLPNEMIRQGWELCIEDDGDTQQLVSDVVGLLEDHELDNKCHQSLCLERAVGGAGLVFGVNDLKDMSDELNLSSISELKWLETFEPIELQAESWQRDPEEAHFGMPDVYRFQPISQGGASKGGFSIHRSRIGIFPGIRVSRRQIIAQMGWGDAVLTRCRDIIRDYQATWAAVGVLIQEFSQAVWKIKGLAEIIALDKDKEIQTRIEMMELAKSLVNAMVLDEDESWERKTVSVNGLDDLLVQFAVRLSAGADTPASLLMGMSPAGLNATGDFDIRSWYDRAKSMQHRKLKPVIEQAVQIAFRVLQVDEPDDWYVKFHPLWQPTQKEEVETRWIQMQIDEKAIVNSIYSSDVVAKQRFGGRDYSYSTHLDKSDYSDVQATPEQLASYKQMVGAPEAPVEKPEEPPIEQPTRRVPVNAHERTIRSRDNKPMVKE